MQDTRNAIRIANEKFMEVFKKGDAAAVAALYTQDGRLLPPGSQMVSGTEAIQSFWQGAMNQGIREARLETTDVEERQDIACEIGRYTLRIEPEGGKTLTDRGKYVVVWKKEDGGWKLHIDIWNSSGEA